MRTELEALVAARGSGIPEIVEDGVSGLLVPPGDPAALAAALHCILTKAPLAARLGRGGLQRAEERFDVRAAVAVLQGWWEEAGASGEYPK